MGELHTAQLPMNYDTYLFDLYGTLVDIHTDEEQEMVWDKLSLFYRYYGAIYTPAELKASYKELVNGMEQHLKSTLEKDPKYTHEASPEIEISEVFLQLYQRKGIAADLSLAICTGQFFRVLTTEYVKTYNGTKEMLKSLHHAGKKVYLLSNAQRIFTEYEMRSMDIEKYFDGIMISSDYKTKKPDKRFFDCLLETYHIQPKNALFIGNDSRTDIAGAKSVGLDTFYVKSNISPENDMAEDATYYVKDFKQWSLPVSEPK